MQRNALSSRREFLQASSASTIALLGGELAAQTQAPTHRRVVTGVTESGKSRVASDGRVPPSAQLSNPAVGNTSDDLWVLPRLPASLADQRDPVKEYTRQPWPTTGGAIARMFTWAPGFTFPMHQSDTVDFVFVISGRVEMLLDEGSVTLGPGDTLVQRGTSHGWRVVGNAPCTLAAVIVSAVR